MLSADEKRLDKEVEDLLYHTQLILLHPSDEEALRNAKIGAALAQLIRAELLGMCQAIQKRMQEAATPLLPGMNRPEQMPEHNADDER